MSGNNKDLETLEQETKEWLYSLDYVLEHGGPERVTELLQQLQIRAHKAGVKIPFTANTPYINSIPREKQPPFPGNREIERQIKWKAESADIFRLMLLQQLCTRLASIISSAVKVMIMTAIKFIFKVMLHLEFMHAHFSKDD